jgi:hypothetical protein
VSRRRRRLATSLGIAVAVALAACGDEPASPGAGPAPGEPDHAGGPDAASVPACPTFDAPVAVGQVDAAVREISGLAVSRQAPGALWIHEDGPGQPELLAIDRGAARRAVHRADARGADRDRGVRRGRLPHVPEGERPTIWFAARRD